MYEKRLCVLKQIKKGFTADGGPVTGAVYAERLNGTLTVTPRIAGLSPVSEGRYALSVWTGGEIRAFEWRNNAPVSAPSEASLEKGFSALVCFVKETAEPIAFGRCGDAPEDYGALLAAFSDKEKKKERRAPVPVPLPPTELPNVPSPNVPLAPTVPLPDPGEEEPFRDAAVGYDDEAIAASDYFVCEGAENADPSLGGEGEPCAESAPCPHETDETARPFRLSRGGLTYYNRIAEKLREAFRKYPKDERLKKTFPHSEWVKTEGALLGIVYAEGLPRFLCVAMETVPDEVKNDAVFVPVSCFSDEEGVYVVFQDADTGEYVRVENG